MDRAASVAIDLGAESCRVSLLDWTCDGPVVPLVHRFSNGPITEDGGLRWDLSRICAGVEKGLRLCADVASRPIASIGVDGWAVDYVRFASNGQPSGNPFCYRDDRTVEAEGELHQLISPERLYTLTGIQLLRINTLYQLFADLRQGIDATAHWLNLPEFVTWHLGGQPVSEYSNATHTQLVKMGTHDWCPEIFRAAGLDLSAAPSIVPTGSDVGRLKSEFHKFPVFSSTRLLVPACHDTASAIAGIPAEGDDWAFISSGTWSLVGTLLSTPCVNAEARRGNFTNLGGAGGSICFLKNVNGMWLLSQCMDEWAAQGKKWTISDLVESCQKLPAPDHLLNVDEADLMLPGNMPAKINAQRERAGNRPFPSDDVGIPEMANAIFHSLAARYAEVIRNITKVTGKVLRRVYIVGGASKNSLLNRLTAERTGIEVVRGAAESATIGNFAIQLATLQGDYNSSVGVTHSAVREWASILSSRRPALSTVHKGAVQVFDGELKL